MHWFFRFKIANFDAAGAGGPPDIASQHAQIAAQKQNDDQDSKKFKGLIANIPGIGKLDTAADALKLLNESIAPKIDPIVNLGKDGGGLQTGSLASSFNPGGLAGSLKILGETVALKTEAYDPSILEGKTPSLNNQVAGGGQELSHSDDGTGGYHDNHGGHASDYGNSGHDAHQDYKLPDLSGANFASSSDFSSGEGGFAEKFSKPQSFANRISSSAASHDDGGHGRD
jgi:hypothetical protein